MASYKLINFNDLESLKVELNKRVHAMCETAPIDAGERLMNVIDTFMSGGMDTSDEKAALPLQNVTNSLKAIELTHDEAKHVNKVIRDKEDMDGEIVGYLLEVLMKIEQQFPDLES